MILYANNKKQKVMVKKFRIEKWELYYVLVIMVMFGFWVGYILGGSSSWATKPDIMNEIIPNGSVIISSLIIIFLLIKVILYYYRKIELTNRKSNSKIQGRV